MRWEWEAGIEGKGEGTEEARRAREIVCWARVMVGGRHALGMRIERDGGYMALMSLSRTRAGEKVVTLSLWILVRCNKRTNPSVVGALFLATAVLCLGLFIK